MLDGADAGLTVKPEIEFVASIAVKIISKFHLIIGRTMKSVYSIEWGDKVTGSHQVVRSSSIGPVKKVSMLVPTQQESG